MVKRSLKSRRTSSAVDQLQVALIRSLKESVAETVGSVCDSFQLVVEEKTAEGATNDSTSYDVYHSNCRRLVDYIQQNMEVSPGFADQMERIILACHSGATERVLNVVVTKQLWFHRREDAPPSTKKTWQTRNESPQRSRSSSGLTRLRSRSKVKREVSVSPSQSTRMATRASTVSPVVRTRSASSSKRPTKCNVNSSKQSTSGNKRVTRGNANNTQPSKRPRYATRKVIRDRSENEKKENVEPENEHKEGKESQGRGGNELLPFKDAIGELCYPDRRAPAKTKFFKDRLRKSIQFVDALLCKPPLGKLCRRDCKKIRAQMCSNSTPCKNKMCRIWHDVEAHAERCQNTHCEFKNRILLRETMHKLSMKEQQLAEIKSELQSKEAELKESGDDEKDAVKDDIAGLEHDLDDCACEIRGLEATKKAFWSNLNDIGIGVSDDIVDNLPDFDTHYEDKKKPRKARKDVAAANVSHLSSRSSRASRAAARRVSAGPHGDDDENEEEADDDDDESVGIKTRRRTAHRSTPSGRRNAPSHPKSVDESEGKMISEDGDMKDGYDEMRLRDSSDSPLSDEPPLPPAGPPPFRQNPELDREYAVVASRYFIRSSADGFEAPAVATNIELTTDVDLPASNGLAEEKLADTQRASAEISRIMANMSTFPPPDNPLTTTSVSSNSQPVEYSTMMGVSSSPLLVEPHKDDSPNPLPA